MKNQSTIDIEELTAIIGDTSTICATIVLSQKGAIDGSVTSKTINTVIRELLYHNANKFAEANLILTAALIKKEIVSFDAVLTLHPDNMRKDIERLYNAIFAQLAIDTPQADIDSILHKGEQND